MTLTHFLQHVLHHVAYYVSCNNYDVSRVTCKQLDTTEISETYQHCFYTVHNITNSVVAIGLPLLCTQICTRGTDTKASMRLHSISVCKNSGWLLVYLCCQILFLPILLNSGGASAAKEPSHFKVRTSSNQVTWMQFFPRKSWRLF